MSTLHLQKREPVRLIAGCSVTLGDLDTIEYAIKLLRKKCFQAKRGGKSGFKARPFHESKGEKVRRKHMEAVRRHRRRKHRDP